jgi:polyribonucleotide nucleotidyltransferase
MKAKQNAAAVKPAKVVVPAEDAAVALGIKDIQAMSSFEEVTHRLMTLRTTVDDLMSRQQDLTTAMHVSDKMRAQAAAAQNYTAAQEHKEACDAKKVEIDALTQERARQSKLRDAAGERQKDLFLSDVNQPHNQPEKVSVSLVRVINPATSNYISAPYFEGSDNVSISLDGKSFDSEAWHVSEWASQHGFIVVSTDGSVTL